MSLNRSYLDWTKGHCFAQEFLRIYIHIRYTQSKGITPILLNNLFQSRFFTFFIILPNQLEPTGRTTTTYKMDKQSYQQKSSFLTYIHSNLKSFKLQNDFYAFTHNFYCTSQHNHHHRTIITLIILNGMIAFMI